MLDGDDGHKQSKSEGEAKVGLVSNLVNHRYPVAGLPPSQHVNIRDSHHSQVNDTSLDTPV